MLSRSGVARPLASRPTTVVRSPPSSSFRFHKADRGPPRGHSRGPTDPVGVAQGRAGFGETDAGALQSPVQLGPHGHLWPSQCHICQPSAPRSATEPFSSDRGASVVLSLSTTRIPCPQWLCQIDLGGDLLTSRSSPPSLSTASRRGCQTNQAQPSPVKHIQGCSQGREKTSDPD